MLLLRIITAPFYIAYYRLLTLVMRRKQIREGASTEELRAFFKNPANFEDRTINEIESMIGRWQEYDDWDRGRVLYEWVRKDLCIRVMYRSDTLVAVEFCHPKDRSRFGPREVIWEKCPGEKGLGY